MVADKLQEMKETKDFKRHGSTGLHYNHVVMETRQTLEVMEKQMQ